MTGIEIQPNTTVLVLNASYEPIHIATWKRAIVLLLKEKAQMLSSRVIRLVNYVKIPLSRIVSSKPSRAMIYKRDGYKCCYCSSSHNLTIDHIIPRSKNGENTWENLCTSCAACNAKKGDKLLQHTNMKLLRQPRAPYNKMQFILNDCKIKEWTTYIHN